jgi:hypothetical protein
MNKNVNRRFLVAISVFATILGFSYYCFAVKLNNSQCLYSVGSYTCETATNYACTAGAGSYPGDCISCESPASLPVTACMPLEGSTCELDGSAGTNCEDAPRKRASCNATEIVPGTVIYACGTFFADGSCDSSSNFLPCN